MNLIEALKSGKPFRRPEKHMSYFGRQVGTAVGFTVEDVLAETWEIEEEKVTVTRSQVEMLQAWV